MGKTFFTKETNHTILLIFHTYHYDIIIIAYTIIGREILMANDFFNAISNITNPIMISLLMLLGYIIMTL